MQTRATNSGTLPVSLTSASGEIATGEVLEGDGQRVVVGLSGSATMRVAVGASLGFELCLEECQRRLPVTLVATGARDGVRILEVELSQRALLGFGQGSTLSALFNERAAFRLPIKADTIRGAMLRAYKGSRSAPKGAPKGRNGARNTPGNPVSARILDASFDGLGVLVASKEEQWLQSIEDVRVEFGSEQGLVVVEGHIRHRQALPKGGGLRLGLAAGASKSAPWTGSDEQRLRRFVNELQRATLARLRCA